MHCQLLLSLKINTRKVRQKDIENNNHISNKDRDKRMKKRRSKKEMTRKYDHCLGTTKYNENENIPCHCHNIIYKERICTNDVYQKEKMRGRRPRHYDDNGLSFTSSVHHLPRRLKSLKKIWFELITLFTQLFVYRCFKANTKKSTNNRKDGIEN